MVDTLFIDTWAWLSIFDKKESGHKKCTIIFKKYLVEKIKLVTTDYVLDETITRYCQMLWIGNSPHR